MADDVEATKEHEDAEQGRPRELTEQRFAANLRVIREAAGVSQVALAQDMVARGWPWRQQTVTRIESGQRLVRLGEAKTVADILRTSLDRLTEPTAEMREVELLSEWIRQAREAWRQIAAATATLLNARGLLRDHPALASGKPGSPRATQAVQAGRDVQELTPEGAVAEGIAQLARQAAIAADRADLEGSVDIKPRNWADAQAIASALRDGEIVVIDFSETPVSEVGRLQDFISGAVTVRGGSVQLLQKAPPGAEHPNQGRYRLTPATLSSYEQRISALTPDAGGDHGSAADRREGD